MNTESIIRRLERDAQSAQYAVDEFKAKLAEDPFHAFRWSDDACKAAARLHVFASVVEVIKSEKHTMQLIAEMVQSNVVSKAQSINNPCSGFCGGVMAAMELAAWADCFSIVQLYSAS